MGSGIPSCGGFRMILLDKFFLTSLLVTMIVHALRV